MYHLFSELLSNGFGWIFLGGMVFMGVRRNQHNRHHRGNHHQHYMGGQPPYNNLNQGGPPPPVYKTYTQPYTPPPTPFNYGPGYPGPNAPGYMLPPQPPVPPQPMPNPGWSVAPPPNNGWSPSNNGWSQPDPNAGQTAWPEPVVPNSRVIHAAPSTTPTNNPNSPTKDIFVWGRSMAGWVYAGKLTVVKTLGTSEIRQYADGKFGAGLQDKLCIEADDFEQARYIFEQSRMI